MEVHISTKYQLQRYTEIVTRNSSTAYNNSIGLGSTPGELLRTTCVSRRGETFFCRFTPTVRVYNKARHSLLTFAVVCAPCLQVSIKMFSRSRTYRVWPQLVGQLRINLTRPSLFHTAPPQWSNSLYPIMLGG